MALLDIPVGFDFSGADADVQQALTRVQAQFNKLQSPGYQLGNPQAVLHMLNTPAGAQMAQSTPALQQAIAGLQRAIETFTQKLAAPAQPTQAPAGRTTPTQTAATPPPQAQTPSTPNLGGPPKLPTPQGQTVGGPTTTQQYVLAQQQLQQTRLLNQNLRSANGTGTTTAPPGTPRTSNAGRMRIGPNIGQAYNARFGTASIATRLTNALGGSGIDAASLGGAAGDVTSLIASLLGAGGVTALAAGGAVGGAVIGGMKLSDFAATNIEGVKRNLAANVAGEPWGTSSLFPQAVSLAQTYTSSQQNVGAVMDILGRTGVRPPNVGPIAQNALAFSNVSGLPSDQLAQLAGQLNVSGGMSPNQIGALFESVVTGSTSVGQSMTKLVDTLSAFATATSNTALTLKGAQSLISLQGYVAGASSQINAGQAISTMAGATGVTRMKLSSVLGMSETQYMALQKQGPTALYGAGASYLKSQASAVSGQPMADQISYLEALNANLGLFNTQGMSASAQDAFFQQVLTKGPQAAAQYFSQHQGGTGTPTQQMQALRNRGKAAAGLTHGATSKVSVGIQGIIDAGVGRVTHAGDVTIPPSPGHVPGALPGTPMGTEPVWQPLLDVLGLLNKAGVPVNALPKGAQTLIGNAATGVGNALGAAGGALGGAAGSLGGLFSALGTALSGGGETVHAAGLTPAQLRAQQAGSGATGVGLQAAIGGLVDTGKQTNDQLSLLPDRIAQAIVSVLGSGSGSGVGGSTGGGASGVGTGGSTSSGVGGTAASLYGGGTGAGAGGVITGASVGGLTVPNADLPYYIGAAKAMGIPLNVLLAQGKQESGFTSGPNEVSSAGALGIAQFTAGTWNGLAKNPKSPNYQQPFSMAANADVAIPTQAFLLQQLYKQYGTTTKMLEAYYGGAGGVANPNEYVPGGPTPAQYAAQIEANAAGAKIASMALPGSPTQVQVHVTVHDQTKGGISAQVGTTVQQSVATSASRNPPKARTGRPPYIPVTATNPRHSRNTATPS